ncbi:MAG TPA: fatty acid desaturase family protein [Candidatus Binataceae bacterium]|nr:fatty acid desaturase family protein [Candidatus Binataceae bacterium]
MNTSNEVETGGRIATPVKLGKEELLALSQINPLMSVYHIMLEWILIIAAIACCQHWWNPWLYVGTVIFIGARQHALLILMHDGTHYRLFGNRRLNDWLSELLLAWPHLTTMRAYRHNHMNHHNFVNSEQDPDWRRKKDNPEWRFPQPLSSLLRIALRDLSGVGGVNLIRLASSFSAPDKPSKAFVRARVAFYVAALAAIIWTREEEALILYWVVPFFTWLIVIMRWRSIAEHFAIDYTAGAFGQSRTMQVGLVGRLLVAPKNVSYHIEHHFFPSVPFFRLPQLHALLMSKAEFASSAHITRSYAALLRECMGRPQPHSELPLVSPQLIEA